MTDCVLGKLCRNGHEYDRTGRSLRSAVTGRCMECQRLRRRRAQAKRPKAKRGETRVGALCKRGHRHEGTEGSLRSVRTGLCMECVREASEQRRQKRVAECATRTYVGSLCKRGHWMPGTDGSLRYTRNGSCVACMAGYELTLEQAVRKRQLNLSYYHRRKAEDPVALAKEYRDRRKQSILRRLTQLAKEGKGAG